jgi:hypothetical protein
VSGLGVAAADGLLLPGPNGARHFQLHPKPTPNQPQSNPPPQPQVPNPKPQTPKTAAPQVKQFYTAPTAIRSLMRAGDALVKEHSRASLRILGSVGEPINPEAWRWWVRLVGAREGVGWGRAARSRGRLHGVGGGAHQPRGWCTLLLGLAGAHQLPCDAESTRRTQTPKAQYYESFDVVTNQSPNKTPDSGTTTLWVTASPPWWTRGGRPRRAAT